MEIPARVMRVNMVSLSEQKKSRIALNPDGSVVVTIMLLGCKYRFGTAVRLKIYRFQAQTITEVSAEISQVQRLRFRLRSSFEAGQRW